MLNDKELQDMSRCAGIQCSTCEINKKYPHGKPSGTCIGLAAQEAMHQKDENKKLLEALADGYKSIRDIMRHALILELDDLGVNIPDWVKIDYTEFDMPDKTWKFMKICRGRLGITIYVEKGGNDSDEQYYDLLCVVDEDGNPVCIPVPIARKLFGSIDKKRCMHVLPGSVYEYTFKAYYDRLNAPKTNKMPF